MSKSGQKFVARNRAPRVQIEYDVELYGAEKKVQLPFVMGVMSDLSGKSEAPLPSVEDRKFLEIDVDNFDERMKAIRPRAAFSVPNTLTGEGNLSVDLNFERMEDFSPAAIAQKVAPLRKLLEARTQLSHLATYMDGKTGAEELIAKLISDPAALSALLANAGGGSGTASASALQSLRDASPEPVAEQVDGSATALASLRASQTEAPASATDTTNNVLDSLRSSAPAAQSTPESETPDRVLEALRQQPAPATQEANETGSAFESLLSSAPQPTEDQGGSDATAALEQLRMTSNAQEEEVEEDDLQALLLGDEDEIESDDIGDEDDDEDFDLDALLADDDTDLSLDDEDEVIDEEEDDLDLDALLSDETEEGDEESDEEDLDLSGLLADSDDAQDEDLDDTDEDMDLDDLDLALDDESEDEDVDDDDDDDDFDLDALLSDDDEDEGEIDLADLDEDEESDDFDLDALLADDEDTDTETPAPAPSAKVANPFGILTAERPADLDATRPKFRIAILGDFTGRASRGALEIGDGLASRKPIKLDVDNIDAVIARFATKLVLPIGDDGAGIEVALNSLDDLHPDELYDNVEIFQELSSLRQQVARGDAASLADLQSYVSDAVGKPLSPRARAKGSSVPADRKLSDFLTLIGDMQGHLAKASPASELIGRIVAPYVKAAPDPAQDSMLAAIDEALSGAMRAILHHPDFQAVESTWRSLDLLTRRIETSSSLEITLYDVSAEEWAADLAAQDDVAQSGLFKLLAEEPRLDEAQGAFSAVFGFYTLEETPPHAELMARMAKISAWMNAPFMASISPHFLEVPKQDRHPLTAKKWDSMRALPEAAYVGLAAPRFLLRLPYGKRTEPVDPFDFEEFTLRAGLKGMLWANPVVLSAILMAETVNRMGKDMKLGEIMSLDDIPVHTMTDQYGDQVALPCTERLLNTRTMADVVTRGYMPLLSIKGRNEVRQGSFQSLAGDMLSGPWTLAAGHGKGTSGTSVAFGAALEASSKAAPSAAPKDAAGSDVPTPSGDDADAGSDDDDDMDLDALLAGFEDGSDSDDTSDDDDMDAELAALLEGL